MTGDRHALRVLHAAGVAQGIALVTFPAASAIFTDPAHYGLGKTAYGAMFLPQALTAIASSLLGAGLTRRLGATRLFVAGLVANLLAMALLVASAFVQHRHGLAYGLLLVATGCLGVGFGLAVPALNTLVAAARPRAVDRAVLVLNALLGLGTALAPAFVAVFVGLGVWWGLPVAVCALLAGVLAASRGLPLPAAAPAGRLVAVGAATTRSHAPFRLLGLCALLYGVVETLNGNWATLYMRRDLGASAATASLALAVFWGLVTGGRVLFAALDGRVSERTSYRVLPVVAAAACLALGWLPRGRPAAGVAAFGLAGLGCSALLPLTISFGQRMLGAAAGSAAGVLIALYQTGYGIAAFGVGPLQQRSGVPLHAVFAGGAGVALLLAFLAARATIPHGR